MRFEGKLKSWNDERGFGFIAPLKGGEDLFVHIKSFPPGSGRPSPGLPLTFEVEQESRGRMRAVAVQFVRPASRAPRHRAEAPAPWSLAIPTFLGVYGLLAAQGRIGPWVAMAYAAISLATFAVYAFDKSAARHGRWRTPESTLHALALIGGWPGALLAQQLLRHKSSKPAFVATFWGTVCLNVAAFIAAHALLSRH